MRTRSVFVSPWTSWSNWRAIVRAHLPGDASCFERGLCAAAAAADGCIVQHWRGGRAHGQVPGDVAGGQQAHRRQARYTVDGAGVPLIHTRVRSVQCKSFSPRTSALRCYASDATGPRPSGVRGCASYLACVAVVNIAACMLFRQAQIKALVDAGASVAEVRASSTA